MAVNKMKYLLFFTLMLILGLFLHVFQGNRHINYFLNTRFNNERTIKIMVISNVEKAVYLIPAGYTYRDMLIQYKIRLKTGYSGDIHWKLIDGEEYRMIN